jgi:pimeloyl-ACP methyl ester carboxylesterase
MRRFTSSRAFIVNLTILAATVPLLSRAEDASPLRPEPNPAPSNIVIGFVGGFVHHDNPHHGPVQLAQQIQRTVPKDTYVRVFENRRRKQAYDDVVRLLDTNRDGILSAEEKARARIILFGHSWGASAAVLLARDLRREGVPVLLTVQVDSVAKVWQNDSVIPDNVAEAVNFYQPHGIVHGRRQITAANPARTAILGNYLVDYRKTPVQCPGASWADRFFTPSHMQSECDPHLWSRIETMVHDRLASVYNSSAPAATASAATSAASATASDASATVQQH